MTKRGPVVRSIMRAVLVASALAFVLAGLVGAWRSPWLSRADLGMSEAVQRWRRPPVTVAMEVATLLGSELTLIAIVVVAAVGLLRQKRRPEAIAATLSLLALALNPFLKLLANRPRPDRPIEVLVAVTGTSFPSGHAMNSAAVYGTLAALAWRLGARKGTIAALIAVPLVVGVSRVYLGVHWSYDVLAGWAAGALCVGAIALWLRASNRVRA